MQLSSTSNPTFKNILNLKDKKYRKGSDNFIVEGQKQVNEIPTDWQIQSIVVSENFSKKNKTYTNQIVLSDKLFTKISSTNTPQGIIAIVKKKKFNLENCLKQKGFILIADNISDPGNLGTIIRCADAFGAGSIFISKHSVDLYSDKVVRATMGSMFHLPIFTQIDTKELIAKLKENNFKICATDLNSKNKLSKTNFTDKVAFIVGNESKGVSKDLINLADFTVKIDMAGNAESLNVAIASAIMMYVFSTKN